VPRLRVPQISLAVKCQLLFGLAVVLILAAALLVPWFQMNKLVDELHKREAMRIAENARDRIDPGKEKWTTSEPGIELIKMRPGLLEDDALDPFIRRALESMIGPNPSDFRLTRRVDEHGKVWYRYALAVRDQEGPDPSHRLLGVVSVMMEAKDPQLTKWNHLLIVMAGVLAGLLAVLVFYLIVTKLILSPVRDLKLVAEQVEHGDLKVRSTIHTGDEFEELSQTFNRMLAGLVKSRDELETINRSLDTRLGELAQTNVTLYESHRMQSEFLANVSHELRTPLSSIIGFAELLQDATAPPEDGNEAGGATAPKVAGGGEATERIRRYAANILTSGRMLLDMINDLLDLARIESGKMTLHRTRFQVRELCEDLLAFIKPLVDKKDLRADLQIVEEPPEMHSDAGKIKQILYNLLSNAIKFTPERGSITLSVEMADRSHLRLSVSDTGPGIAPQDQTAIFEKFRQMDGSMTRKEGGSGLGLPISKELAALLGGSLSLRSELGAGSTFILTLPLECPEQVERALVHLNI
jgi:signal transduction histidine kinase